MSADAPKRKWAILPELLYLLRSQKPMLATIVFASIAVACLNMAVPRLVGFVIDEALPNANMSLLLRVLAAVLVVYVGKNALFYLSKSRITILGEKIAFDVRTALLQHLHKLSVAFYKSNRPGKISARLMQDVSSIRDFVQGEMARFLIDTFMLMVALAMLLELNVVLAVISLAVLPFHLLILRAFRGSITRSAREAKEYISEISGDVIEQFTGMETVKSSVSESREQQRFQRSMSMGMTAQIRQSKYYLLQKISSDMLSGLSYMVILGFGGYAVIRGIQDPGARWTMRIGEFVAFFLYVARLYPIVISLISQAAKASSTLTSIDRIYEILHMRPEVEESPGARPHRIERGKVEFRNVSFAYGQEEVLRQVNFTIEPGEHVLVSGASGCGKTTLLNLIPRFYDPTRGNILIDGMDLRDYSLSSLRDQIGVVFQDPFLFNTSVLDNIRYARTGASDAEVVEAAKRAYAHDFISQLADGYFTLIGEGGVQLSGGERQRLVIARTILKNPAILILDEALASLDAESRRRLAAGILELAEGRTLFVVTHALSIFPDVNKELKIVDGHLEVYPAADAPL